jgi:uncharacterized protein YjeT (DUF2065 family)
LPVHKRIIDNAATSLVEQASCLFIKGLLTMLQPLLWNRHLAVHKRIIDNAATSLVEQASCLFIKGLLTMLQPLLWNRHLACSSQQSTVSNQQSTVNNHLTVQPELM